MQHNANCWNEGVLHSPRMLHNRAARHMRVLAKVQTANLSRQTPIHLSALALQPGSKSWLSPNVRRSSCPFVVPELCRSTHDAFLKRVWPADGSFRKLASLHDRASANAPASDGRRHRLLKLPTRSSENCAGGSGEDAGAASFQFSQGNTIFAMSARTCCHIHICQRAALRFFL